MRPPERLGPYVYRQSDTCFPLGRDTLLLAEFAALRRGGRVCDLGCGAGALPLLLLGREPTLHVTGIELDPEDARLARQNLAENGLTGEVYTADLRRVREFLPPGVFELTVSNPPYFPRHAGASGGPARMEERCTLADVCGAAAYLTKNGGRFALVHRPERLCDIVEALRAQGLEPKRLRLVRHGPEHPPFAALVESVRQGRPGLEITVQTLHPAKEGTDPVRP